MEGKVDKTRASVISDLPESVLHHILSHLPLKDSVRTSVLSKLWNSARKSYPFLDFIKLWAMDFGVASSLEFKAKLRRFLDFVDRSLRHFDQNKLSIERMHLNVYDIDPDSVPLINTWLPLALRNGVSDLEFLAHFVSEDYGDLLYPLPESTFTVNSSLFRSSFKFFRLNKLKLETVYLSENVVRDIIRNCPNIIHLSLEHITGLETLNISKLNKLVRLVVSSIIEGIMSVYVNALSLQHVSFSECGDSFDLASCCNLKEIKLERSGITDAQFHHHITKFPLLEVLHISYCHGLQRIKISLQRLKHLLVWHCKRVKAIEIDAPSLLSLEFKLDSQNVLISVSSKVVRCSMYLSYGMQYPHSWSLKLREYLGVPFDGVNFVGKIIKFTFAPGISRWVVSKVDCLDLTGLRIDGSFHWVTLLDTLLSGCHPKLVSMTVDSNDESNCVNIFRKMLVQSECQLCCNSPQCKCWRRQLKGAKIESINGNIDHKQLFREKDTFLSIPVDSKVTFGLDWDNNRESLTRISISSE